MVQFYLFGGLCKNGFLAMHFKVFLLVTPSSNFAQVWCGIVRWAHCCRLVFFLPDMVILFGM